MNLYETMKNILIFMAIYSELLDRFRRSYNFRNEKKENKQWRRSIFLNFVCNVTERIEIIQSR